MDKKEIDNNEKEDTKHNIIYFTNLEKTFKRHSKKDVRQESNKIEPTRYIAPLIFTILIYSLCAWATKVNFTEIIDLEIPLIILLTLILTESVIQGYSKISYLIYIIASILCYNFIKDSYALFIIIPLTGVLITRCLEKIYYNQKDYPNLEEDEFKILSFLPRVKYHIILSLIIFVIFLLLGYFYPGIFQPLVAPSVENLHNGVREGTIALETFSLFWNNLSVALGMIIGGLYFSTHTIYSLIFNALFIGFSGAITKIDYFLAFTVPHGIIELSAIILASAGGLRITHAFLVLLNGIKLNKPNKREIFLNGCNNFIKMFIDVIMLTLLIVIMLFIAAFIEANLTVNIGTLLYNF